MFDPLSFHLLVPHEIQLHVQYTSKSGGNEGLARAKKYQFLCELISAIRAYVSSTFGKMFPSNLKINIKMSNLSC